MLRVDLERKTVEASVRALVAGPPRPGGGVAGARREWGLEVHRRYREQRARFTPGFRAEVAVAWRHAVDGFELSLTGRADGVIESGEARIVEEVKSAPHATAEHRLQLRAYALCLWSPQRPVRTRLVLADGDVELAFDPVRTTRQIEERVRAVIADARRREERLRERRALAAELRFPYASLRRGQETLMDAIAEGLAEGRPVLAQAATGIGKTVCALLPALRFALEHDARLFFLTAKTTQQRLVTKTFRDLAPDGLRAMTLRAKARMCPPRTLLCHPDHCAYLATPCETALVPPAPHLAPDVIFRCGEEARVCPYALSLALAAEADLVIGDYNYVYGSAGPPDPERTVVIVDEAHNLSDRVRAHHSPVLTRASVAATAWRFPSLFARLDECIAEREVRPEAWAELRGEAVERTVRYAQGPIRPDDPLLDVLETVVRLHDALRRETPEFVPYADGERVGVWCVNAAPVLAPVQERLRGCVAMSATLTPAAHHAATLGLEDPVELSVPSPFPPENRRVVIVPTVRTTLRERKRHYGKIAREIERIVAVHPGRYVAYFPSFAFLDAVHAHLEGPGVGAQRRGARDHPGDHPLLLAVLGGMFAEGIDVRGLDGAIIVGPGLPAADDERRTMQAYFDQLNGHGFRHAMLHPGMQRVVQAAGRVHRAPEDKGVIVLLDRRFAQSPYKECLPAEWFRYGPEELVAEDPTSVLDAFWNASRGVPRPDRVAYGESTR